MKGIPLEGRVRCRASKPKTFRCLGRLWSRRGSSVYPAVGRMVGANQNCLAELSGTAGTGDTEGTLPGARGTEKAEC